MSRDAGEHAVETIWRWVVSGRVQGVWYRDFTRREARSLGLAGWVKNLPDGTVELAVRGPADKLAALRARLREGPPAARVDAISEQELAGGTELPETFEVRY
jgi:acylphosphatase